MSRLTPKALSIDLNGQLINGLVCIRDIGKYSYQSILSSDLFSVGIQLFLYVWSYRLGWVEISTWRRWVGLAHKSATGDPLFLIQNERATSPFDHQSILMKDHFMGTAKHV